MDWHRIPDDRYRTSRLPTYRLEERYDRFAAIICVVIEQVEIQAEVPLGGTYGHWADYGDSPMWISNFAHGRMPRGAYVRRMVGASITPDSSKNAR